MMKADDFYKILQSFDSQFSAFGYKRRGRNSYEKGDYVLKIVLNDWGWDDENGWGFFVRVIDKRFIDSNGNVDYWDGTCDINPNRIINEHIWSKSTFDKVYLHSKVKHLFKDGGWITFYDKVDLEHILSNLIKPALEFINDWAAGRNSSIQKSKQSVTKNEIVDKLKKEFPDEAIS